MKFFIDTANVDEIREAASLGVLDGVTTNPSLVAKEGKEFRQVLREIVSIVNGPISAEVTATDRDGMVEEGRELSAIHPNIVVKVPLIKEGLQACKQLRAEGIGVNVTLCFSASQALLAAKANATLSRIPSKRTIFRIWGSALTSMAMWALRRTRRASACWKHCTASCSTNCCTGVHARRASNSSRAFGLARRSPLGRR